MSAIGTVETLVVHHSGSPLGTTFEQVEAWHTDPKDLRDGRVRWQKKTYRNRAALPRAVRELKGNGWDAIGYHALVLANGELRQGRPITERGAHAPPNRGRIGICVVGDNTVVGQGWTFEQIVSLRRWVEAAQLLFPGIVVCGHRDAMPGHTECPGLDVLDVLRG